MTSYSDDESFCMYGNPLDPYDEDEIPSKKPIQIEDQVATDSQGRRRFHGAFTGGFSAGFCNTVGSLEGWEPKEYKSSRQSKVQTKIQRPEDFMDEEDIAEYGFAPQGVRATDEYSSITAPRKRKHLPSQGPLPGQPVLELLLQPVRETIGIKLLKQMGWKVGQGVGPRLLKSEKRRARVKRYGCEMPPGFNNKVHDCETESSDDENITFAPDDYDPYVCRPKENTYGMGYAGLDKMPILSGGFASRQETSHLSMIERNNKKVSISGQAFGVGAFEEDDEDIYGKDDLSRYDFELGPKLKQIENKKSVGSKKVLENFVPAIRNSLPKPHFPPPILPKGFKPIHGARISRFEPLPEEVSPKKYKGRHNLTAEERSIIIGDSPTIPLKSQLEVPIESPTIVSENVNEPTTSTIITANVPASESTGTVQLKTEWDQEEEKLEQETQVKKPYTGVMFDRFVAAEHVEDVNNPLAAVEKLTSKHGTKEMIDAARNKMFGKLTRETSVWQPSSLLCKRFNVPEPESAPGCATQVKRKKNTFSVFDYLDASKKNILSAPKEESPSVPSKITTEKPAKPIEISVVKIQTPVPANIEIISAPLPKLPAVPKKVVEESQPPAQPIALPVPIVHTVENDLIKLDTEKKIDLFKAIFLSSSESESENEIEETVPTPIVEEKLPVTNSPPTGIFASVPEEEPKRNLSPPRGIFANIDLQAINRKLVPKPPEVNIIDVDKEETTDLPESYGPKLPSTYVKPVPAQDKSMKPIHEPTDTWVEKTKKLKHSKNKDKKKSKKKDTHKKHKKHRKHKKS